MSKAMIAKALRPGLVVLGLLVALLAIGPAAGSSLWTEQAKLTANDAEAGDALGYSVVLDGHTALVGAYTDDVGGEVDAGSAYVFRWDGETWVEQAKLTASDGQADDLFGEAVALSGTTALVGARLGGTADSGSAYVFQWDGETWVEQAKLIASDSEPDARFGASVALSGNTILVGSHSDDLEGTDDAGSAYVFRWDSETWVEQAKLTAGDAEVGDRFGKSVALNGNIVLVGADEAGAGGAGSAYVYRWDGSEWTEQAKLTAGDGAAGDALGYHVDLSGNAALVGAVTDDVGGNIDAGSAYIFHWDGETWLEEAKLTASDGGASDTFGFSVALSGNTALVGARLHDVGGNDFAGSAYVYSWDGIEWTEQAELTASDGAAIDYFGTTVALAGDTALVGAIFSEVGGIIDAGAAYVPVGAVAV